MSREYKMYADYDDKKKKNFLLQEYITNQKSFSEIAKQVGTYANKIRRDAKRLGVVSRDRSQAAKVALESGRSIHPTKDKRLSDEVKNKISESQGKVWDELSEDERRKRSKIGKDSWESRSEKEKKYIVQKGADAIREAARTGTRMEKFLLYELTDKKFEVQFHKEHLLKNQKLQIDLFIPKLRVAIEIDGPSHFRPVWGEDNLERNKRSDRQKTGLILGQGFVLIRIRQDKRISQRYFRRVLDSLVVELEKIKQSFPQENKRYIEL
jgi:very-short-patch-repair endonuclease